MTPQKQNNNIHFNYWTFYFLNDNIIETFLWGLHWVRCCDYLGDTHFALQALTLEGLNHLRSKPEVQNVVHFKYQRNVLNKSLVPNRL